MTDDVAAHVLIHNYDQTAALTLSEATALIDHDSHERLMTYLEERDVLDRELEELPSSAAMAERAESGIPLTRPELSVLLAWSKITLFDDIVASDLPDDPWLKETLTDYFPKAIRRFDTAIHTHRLKREIVSTVVSNRLLDVAGPVFLTRLRETGGSTNAILAKSFEAARHLLNFADFKAQTDALDNQASTRTQTQLRLDAKDALFLATSWLANHYSEASLGEIVSRFDTPLAGFKSSLRETASVYGSARIERRARHLMRGGAPEALARWSAAYLSFAEGIAVAGLSVDLGRDIVETAHAYFEVGDKLRLDRLRVAASEGMRKADYWDRVASRRLIDELSSLQLSATRKALLEEAGPRIWLDPETGGNDRVDPILAKLWRRAGLELFKIRALRRCGAALFGGLTASRTRQRFHQIDIVSKRSQAFKLQQSSHNIAVFYPFRLQSN